MKRKALIDLIVAVSLIVIGSIILIFPLFKIVNVRFIFLGILGLYGIVNLIQFILTSKEKDYEGLLTTIASLITILLVGFLDIESSPMNLALSLFVWIILMSLIKLKKVDFYHDRQKRIWILKMITLVLFILTGLLCVINLYYAKEVQVLVIGFFFFIHGILEMLDPIFNYLIDESKRK